MLTINNKKFAKNDNEFTDTLFDSTGTAIGFYRKFKNRVALYDHQNNLFACLVHNRYGEKFFVSASKLDSGKTFYMHGLSSRDEKTLGFDSISYTEQVKIAESLI